MRVARLLVDGRDLAALEHRGSLYRVDRLDEALGAPFPLDVVPSAPLFHRRVFSLALAGLLEHDEALRDGTQLDDARVTSPYARVLAPAGAEPSVLEMSSESRSDLSYRVNGRALLGHDQTGLVPPSSGALLVAPALAVVIADDLHVPSMVEALEATLGLTLALAWSLAEDERASLAEHLGPGSARDVGTHLGPWLTTAGPLAIADRFPLEIITSDGARYESAIELDPERVARAIVRAGRFGDLRAGDVLLLTSPQKRAVDPGVDVTLRSEKLGLLRGRQGKRRTRSIS